MLIPLSFLIIVLIIYISTKYRLSLIHLLLFGFLFKILNVFLLQSEVNDQYTRVNLLAILFFCIPLIFNNRKFNLDNFNGKFVSSRYFSLNAAILIFFFFIFYHYLMVGIPLFSSDIDVSRFSSNNSGLFGIPSRIAVYGPYIILYSSIVFP